MSSRSGSEESSPQIHYVLDLSVGQDVLDEHAAFELFGVLPLFERPVVAQGLLLGIHDYLVSINFCVLRQEGPFQDGGYRLQLRRADLEARNDYALVANGLSSLLEDKSVNYNLRRL